MNFWRIFLHALMSHINKNLTHWKKWYQANDSQYQSSNNNNARTQWRLKVQKKEIHKRMCHLILIYISTIFLVPKIGFILCTDLKDKSVRLFFFFCSERKINKCQRHPKSLPIWNKVEFKWIDETEIQKYSIALKHACDAKDKSFCMLVAVHVRIKSKIFSERCKFPWEFFFYSSINGQVCRDRKDPVSYASLIPKMMLLRPIYFFTLLRDKNMMMMVVIIIIIIQLWRVAKKFCRPRW